METPVDHYRHSCGDFSLEIRLSPEGGWYLHALLWKSRILSEAATAHYAAGWEVTLNATRFTPHTPGITAEPICHNSADGALTLTLPHRLAGGYRLRHQLAFRGDTFEQWVEIENGSDSPCRIENFNFAQLKLDPRFIYGLSVQQSDGYTIRDISEQAFGLENPLVVLRREAEAWGLMVLNTAPGHTHRIAVGTYLSVGYANESAPFCWELEAGDVFISDRAAFLPFENEHSPALYDYCRQLHSAGGGTRLDPSPAYCSWEPFGRSIDEAKILQQIDHAAALGFSTFIIDDGWQTHAGDWTVDPDKFPRDFDPILERLAAHQMELGLWISLSTLHTDSKAYPEFEDCVVCDHRGQPRLTHVFEGSMTMACLNTRYSDHIEARLHSLVDQYRLKYLKIDLPVVYDVYNKPAIACHASGHEHSPGCDYFLKTYRRVQHLLRSLKAAHPHLLIDVTFELWGGWHQIDYGLIACADLCWLSNIADAENAGGYGPAQVRHLAAERSHLLPPEHCVIGNLRCNGPHPTESVLSAFAAYPMLLGDLSALTEQQSTEIQTLLAWLKAQADEFDLCQHYGVLTPITGQRPGQHSWSGFLRCDRHGNGILALFRNLSPVSTETLPIPLPETLPGKSALTLQSFSKKSPVTATADALRQGLAGHIPATHGWSLYALRSQ